MNPLLTRIMANKHTTFAGLAYLACVFISKVTPKVAAIWFPEHAGQIQQSEEVVTGAIKDLSMGYGFLMGADAMRKPIDSETAAPSGTVDAMKKVGLLIGFMVVLMEVRRLI